MNDFRTWLIRNRQFCINFYLFLNVTGFICWQLYQLSTEGRIDFIEISFILQNSVMAAMILLRRNHFAIDSNIGNQLVAICAFFSGIAFMGQPPSGGASAILASQGILLCANALGIATLVNLGRSFGILIACRGVKTGGMYRIVRHPMYASDILLRVGFVVSHFNVYTVALFFISSACYVYRAILEERFLANQPEYREYMNTVRYRFIPFVF